MRSVITNSKLLGGDGINHILDPSAGVMRCILSVKPSSS